MADWQPIETAPKDGTQILGYDPDSVHYDSAFNDYEGRTISTGWVVLWWQGDRWKEVHYSAFSYHPTKWMPLPEPPK